MTKNNRICGFKNKACSGNSLLTLLKGNPFNKITVNDVCTEALVSRSAFYANFKDKYDLLSFCLEIFKRIYSRNQKRCLLPTTSVMFLKIKKI